MTEKPLVSVIINCYNGEKYLREAIDSVIAQTYENWELVFWDNQSTDSTREIVENYHNPKIHYCYASEHTPLGEARNLAVEKANGEYINFLDADDVWMPEKLEKQIALVIPGKVEVVYTNFDVLYDKNQPVNERMLNDYRHLKKRVFNKKLSFYENLLIHNSIIFSSVLFNKELFCSVGGINVKFNQNEDYEILLKTALKTEALSTGDKDVLYRIHSNNNSSKNGSAYLIENREIYKELPASKALENAKIANEVRYAIFLYRNGYYWNALLHFIKFGNFFQLFSIIRNR